MEQLVVFKKFFYFVPSSSCSLDLLKRRKIFSSKLPLLKLMVDFESGVLNLEGDWQYLIQWYCRKVPGGFNFYHDRIHIQAAILEAQAIDPAGSASDGLVLPLEGFIDDGADSSSCSGVLILDKPAAANGNGEWDISICFNDLLRHEAQIRLRFTLVETASDQFEYIN